jgi:hypothetical protein
VATLFASKQAQEHPKQPRNEGDIEQTISPSFLGCFGYSWAHFEANGIAMGPPVIHPRGSYISMSVSPIARGGSSIGTSVSGSLVTGVSDRAGRG